MKNKFGRWSKEILWLERQKTNFVFFRNPPFFLCFFLKTLKIKISTVWQARDLPESPKTLFRHVTSPSLKEKAKIKERNGRRRGGRGVVFFFLLFLSSSSSSFKIQFLQQLGQMNYQDCWNHRNRNYFFCTSKRTKDQ